MLINQALMHFRFELAHAVAVLLADDYLVGAARELPLRLNFKRDYGTFTGIIAFSSR